MTDMKKNIIIIPGKDDDTSKKDDTTTNTTTIRINLSNNVQTLSGTSESCFQKFKGHIACSLLILIWVSGSYLFQYLQKGSNAYQQPFFMVLYTQAGCILLVPLVGIVYSIDIHTYNDSHFNNQIPTKIFSKTSAVLGSFVLAFRYLWVLSLSATAVSINTVLYDSYIFIVLFLSTILLKEKITPKNLFAVFGGFIAVIGMVFGAQKSEEKSKEKSEQIETTLTGIIATLLSSFIYSLYCVSYKSVIGSGGSGVIMTTTEALALMGRQTINGTIIGLALLPFLHMTGIETFDINSTLQYLPILTLLAIQSVTYYAAFAVATTYSSPLKIAISTLLVLPITLGIDFIFYNIRLTSIQYFSAILIAISFILITTGNS